MIEFPFHTLLPGQRLDFPAIQAELATGLARDYHRRWRKRGWAYTATALPDGGVSIMRLPDALPGASCGQQFPMPVDHEAKYGTELEDELLRVMRRVLSSLEIAMGFPSMKPEFFNAGFVSVSVLRNYCCRLSAFKQYPLGANKGVDDTLLRLTAKGTLRNTKIGVVKGVVFNG